ncbi:MAG: hypothetical protein J1E35_02470 [Lachnospiraceae bacterium]|nr:hypothetical protein [Lachnospiraceae bacterium]
MSISGITAGRPAGYETGKIKSTVRGQDFTERIKRTVNSDGADFALRNGTNTKPIDKNDALQAYFVSSAQKPRAVTPAYGRYETYETKQYKIVPDNEAGCFTIYDKQSGRIGAFSYSDIKIRKDGETGTEFLISEHGTMCYDVLVLDEELKGALRDVMGKEEPETEELRGYTLHRHPGTGIRYLVRAGEEGRGGKVLLQSEEDFAEYEKLAETYLNKYPDLIRDKTAAYIWAGLEIRGLAQRAEHGILSINFQGMSYSDNNNYKNNWSISFSEDTYKVIYEYLQNNRINTEEIQKFSVWQDILDRLGSHYERIWSKEEE